MKSPETRIIKSYKCAIIELTWMQFAIKLFSIHSILRVQPFHTYLLASTVEAFKGSEKMEKIRAIHLLGFLVICVHGISQIPGKDFHIDCLICSCILTNFMLYTSDAYYLTILFTIINTAQHFVVTFKI